MNKNMFIMKPKASGISSPVKKTTSNFQIRPGGMLVQQRNSDSNQINKLIPTIKLKIKYGSSYHEANISSQATFGELKKMLAGITGLNPRDQKLMYKDKERDSRAFLDVSGLKDGSKLVLIEDELSIERRILESRKDCKMEKASKDIATIRVEVDKFAKQVASIEMDIYGGKKVIDKNISNLIEHLMAQLIKLDGIVADGDVKLQRKMQVTRVQKYIETLDMLKIRNSTLRSHGGTIPLQHHHGKIFTGTQMQILTQDKPDERNFKHLIQEKFSPLKNGRHSDLMLM